MYKFKAFIRNLIRLEDGASAIEYALLVGIIAVGILASLQGVRDGIITLFGRVVTALTGA